SAFCCLNCGFTFCFGFFNAFQNLSFHPTLLSRHILFCVMNILMWGFRGERRGSSILFYERKRGGFFVFKE
ncbi:MAG: hypothetical protein IKW56_06810, partial [Methanocorpusculum sp.]|nr:hypothetical protein [Methanocorpusculum sp.]